MKIHHIGYAVKNMERAVALFSDVGYAQFHQCVEDTERGVRIQFMKNGPYLIELIAELVHPSPISSYLSKVGSGPYHICYQVEDMEEAIADLKKKRFVLIEGPKKAIALDEKLFLFFLIRKWD